MEINNLQIPLFALYNFNKIGDINFTLYDSEFLKNGYNLNERIELFESLIWAVENPSYDFISIMRNAPTPHRLNFKNFEIYQYLKMFKEFMEDEKFELLTDNRAPKF